MDCRDGIPFEFVTKKSLIIFSTISIVLLSAGVYHREYVAVFAVLIGAFQIWLLHNLYLVRIRNSSFKLKQSVFGKIICIPIDSVDSVNIDTLVGEQYKLDIVLKEGSSVHFQPSGQYRSKVEDISRYIIANKT